MARPRTNRLRWFLLGAGTVLFCFLFYRIGPSEIAALLASLGPNAVVIVAVFGCHECVRAAALARCIHADERPPYRDLLRVRLIGEAAGTLTRAGPLAAEPARAIVMRRHPLESARAVGATASEFLANSLTSALLTATVTGWMLWTSRLQGAVAALGHVLLWGSLAYVCVATSALVSRTYVIGALLRAVGAFPVIGPRLRTDATQVRRMEDAIVQTLVARPGIAGQVVLLELLAQGILVFEIYWTLRSMGVEVTMLTALMIEVLIKAPNTIQFVGATEGGYALIFGWLGMAASVGFALALVKTFRSLSVAAIGLGLLVPTLRSRVRPMPQAEPPNGPL